MTPYGRGAHFPQPRDHSLADPCTIAVLHVGLQERPQDDGDDVAADELRRVPVRAARYDRGQRVK